MNTFQSYHEALRHAQDRADSSGLPVVIRKHKEWGRVVYTVSYRTNDGSDHLAEQVPPRKDRGR